MSLYIRVTKWRDFQHYKDRSPPWIKLHRSMLSSETWVGASNDSRVLAVAIMLLASDTENFTPLNPAYIKRVAYLDFEPDFGPLLDSRFIEIVDENGKVLARNKRMLEKCYSEERRGETEAEKNPTPSTSLRSVPEILGGGSGNTTPENPASPELETAAARDVWAAFSKAYVGRYRDFPVRNAKVNGQIRQLVKRLGAEAGPVAAFYVGHNDARYVREGHTIGMLLAHAEKLATEWRTGTKTTLTQAAHADRLEAVGGTFAKLIEEARREPENP